MSPIYINSVLFQFDSLINWYFVKSDKLKNKLCWQWKLDHFSCYEHVLLSWLIENHVGENISGIGERYPIHWLSLAGDSTFVTWTLMEPSNTLSRNQVSKLGFRSWSSVRMYCVSVLCFVLLILDLWDMIIYGPVRKSGKSICPTWPTEI